MDERCSINIVELCESRWSGQAFVRWDEPSRICHLGCRPELLPSVCAWLDEELDYVFATLIVEDAREAIWSLTYVFYGAAQPPWIHVEIKLDAGVTTAPSISHLPQGPAADWHERETKDLFGLIFEGHPRLGDFILHEDWPEGANPMRRDFDPRRRVAGQEPDQEWRPPTVVAAHGAFAMPIGPVFSDFAESAHFLLETVGEDVIRTIPRLFYKYRGVEKIAEGQSPECALLLAERFSGNAAFAHGLAFCQALEMIGKIDVPPRALALRSVFAELERLRSHAATVTGICNSTALAVAASESALIEEDLLRLSCEVAGHRYLFGLVTPGGMTRDFSPETLEHLAAASAAATKRLRKLHRMLRYSSSFLDRLEQVGTVSVNRRAIFTP
ncbi:NADH-quinone oxidoreductase subunit C [Rhodoblastus sp.]|uniref:NADH-quinone oxidoreductase subunit C n=1 Tax=Rhodoblastus sp. TaxID=1962975 RepID=UPI002620FD70|nr:NADH-quinone oxidoreductase subunit C [Rhodoblastus sp.]